MSTKSLTLPFVCALVTLFASHARAQEFTFIYEGTVTTAEVGSPVSVGDTLRITFTFDAQVQGAPQPFGSNRHYLAAATGRAGTKSWSFDNTFVDITNDYIPATGGFIDEYRVSFGSGSDVEFVLDLFSEGATRPQGLTGPGVGYFQPNPTKFQSKSLTVQTWTLADGFRTATANSPVVVTDEVGRVPCWVHQKLKMTGHALTVEYQLSFTESATLNLFLTSDSATRRLFSVPFGPLFDNHVTLPLPGDLPLLGVVGFLTTLTTNQRGIVCWDLDIIDTGQPSP